MKVSEMTLSCYRQLKIVHHANTIEHACSSIYNVLSNSVLVHVVESAIKPGYLFKEGASCVHHAVVYKRAEEMLQTKRKDYN